MIVTSSKIAVNSWEMWGWGGVVNSLVFYFFKELKGSHQNLRIY